jgi:hypothetical protein
MHQRDHRLNRCGLGRRLDFAALRSGFSAGGSGFTSGAEMAIGSATGGATRSRAD